MLHAVRHRPPKPAGVDYAATRSLGRNATDTPRKQYDTESALFWADGANTSAISGHWLDIAAKVRGAGVQGFKGAVVELTAVTVIPGVPYDGMS